MQRLVRTSENYDSSQVVFLSLTEDPAADLAEIRQFILANGIPWPTGYGAEAVLQAMRADLPPWTVVYGRDGRAVWTSAFEPGGTGAAKGNLPTITVEQAIDLALEVD